MQNSNKRFGETLVFPLLIIGIIFFVIGFGVGISGFLTPFLKKALNLSLTESYLVVVAIFSAFIVFGIPAGWIIKRFGYKRSMVFALVIMALGMYLFVPSASSSSYVVFLLALFVGGVGNTLLQASVNPYVTIIGPIDGAAGRMCLMGIMNKLAWWLGPVFLALFMDLDQVKLNDIVLPFKIVAFILLVLAVIIFFVPLPEINPGSDEQSEVKEEFSPVDKKELFRKPHFLLGVIALFVYVGVETLPMVSILDYSKVVFPLKQAESFSKIVPIGMFVGYIAGTILIPRFLSQVYALVIFSVIGLLASVGLVLIPGNLGIYLFAAIGFSNSVMWGAIWALSIIGLGRLTNSGSSFLVMAIVGGAIIPLLFGMILDAVKSSSVPVELDYRVSYTLFVIFYLYILFYALWGHKIGLKRKHN